MKIIIPFHTSIKKYKSLMQHLKLKTINVNQLNHINDRLTIQQKSGTIEVSAK